MGSKITPLVDMPADGTWCRHPYFIGITRRSNVFQRSSEVAQAVRLPNDVWVQCNAQNQRLTRRLVEHFVELVNNQLGEVLAIHSCE